MAWPVSLYEVYAVGFSRALLPLIKRDLDDNKVEWLPKTNLFAESAVGQFVWHGGTFEMWENWEVVTSIWWLRGAYCSPEITEFLLKDKHEAN